MDSKEIRKKLDAVDRKVFRSQELLSSALEALYEVRVAKEEQAVPVAASWISVEDRMPADDERVVVRTSDGSTYFLHPIGGKFPANVKEWYQLPK
jgi:hypothetical protein